MAEFPTGKGEVVDSAPTEASIRQEASLLPYTKQARYIELRKKEAGEGELSLDEDAELAELMLYIGEQEMRK